MMKNKLALYVHWPFCRSRCAYCDFRTFPYQEKRIPAYVKALQKEIALRGQRMEKPTLTSLYFGGGTPSYIPVEMLEAAMNAIAASFVVPWSIEKTIEMNPEDTTPSLARSCKEMGFNRVSLGVQTFDDRIAKDIGRKHGKARAVQAVYTLREAGFSNISVDLMTGLPGQTVTTLERDFHIIAELPIQHISVYGLILAEHTHMHRRFQEDPSIFPDEDEERILARLAIKKAEETGFHRYEISNFARPGYASRHNLAYWKLRDYLGVGLSAASYYGGIHEKNTDSLREYVQALKQGILPPGEREELTKTQLLSELFLTGLRLKEGVSFRELTDRTDLFPERDKRDVFARYVEIGWLTLTRTGVAATDAGAEFLDTILRDLMD